MTATTIEGLTPEERAKIKQKLMGYMDSMSDAELQIATQSEASFADFLAFAAQAVAGLLGYVIALPIAWAATIAQGIYEGFEKGLRAGWKQGTAKRYRNPGES